MACCFLRDNVAPRFAMSDQKLLEGWKSESECGTDSDGERERKEGACFPSSSVDCDAYVCNMTRGNMTAYQVLKRNQSRHGR